MLDFLKKPKQFTIQEIHDEFDQSGERTLAEARAILAEATVEKDAAKLAAELGFVKSKPVVAAMKLLPTKDLAVKLESYQAQYPAQKFLTVAELERICVKYGLIYAPVEAYTEDIPKQNLIEIASAKQRDHAHTPEREYLFCITVYSEEAGIGVKWRFMNTWHKLPQQFVDERLLSSGHSSWITSSNETTIGGFVSKYLSSLGYNKKVYQRLEVQTRENEGLFIAATPDHFDLKDLEASKNGLGYSKVSKTQIVDEDRKPVKDPIVFQYMKGGFIRVITKWGAEANDPALQVQSLN